MFKLDIFLRFKLFLGNYFYLKVLKFIVFLTTKHVSLQNIWRLGEKSRTSVIHYPSPKQCIQFYLLSNLPLWWCWLELISVSIPALGIDQWLIILVSLLSSQAIYNIYFFSLLWVFQKKQEKITMVKTDILL